MSPITFHKYKLTPPKPAVLAVPEFELKAIYSRSLTSAKALEQNVDLYSDDSGVGKTYHDLLLREDIQAVIIALPIPNQPEHVEAALAAGKHVLSEKPLAATVARARDLIFYSQSKAKNHATWSVAENFRYLDSLTYAQEAIYYKLGKILGFSIKLATNVEAGTKYIGISLKQFAIGHS
jgi:predicted dehydrogenase